MVEEEDVETRSSLTNLHMWGSNHTLAITYRCQTGTIGHEDSTRNTGSSYLIYVWYIENGWPHFGKECYLVCTDL